MLVLLKPWELFIISLVNNIPSQYVPFQFPSQVHVALPFTSTLHVPLFSQGLLTHGETERKEINVWTKGYIVKLRKINFNWRPQFFFPRNFYNWLGFLAKSWSRPPIEEPKNAVVPSFLESLDPPLIFFLFSDWFMSCWCEFLLCSF